VTLHTVVGSVEQAVVCHQYVCDHTLSRPFIQLLTIITNNNYRMETSSICPCASVIIKNVTIAMLFSSIVLSHAYYKEHQVGQPEL